MQEFKAGEDDLEAMEEDAAAPDKVAAPQGAAPDPGGATQHRQQLLLETASGSVVSAMAVVTLLQSLLVLE